MKQVFLKIAVFTALFAVFNNSHAASAEEAVVDSCSAYITSQVIPEDSVCYEYINGFIDGAILTDSAIIENITKEKEEFSSFFKRAYKTRVGLTRNQVPATYYAKFCLPEDQSRKAIVEELIHQLDASLVGKQSFRDTLYDTLKRVYACEG
ncbi:Rap1a/Tai family immunity protein [Marinicella sediminis]|uniref:Rap1a/Tai family immunity protein n=1 Tax=Marinicella sediminis TaxID=1792834 RepID=A0ABV7JAJ5_9GAMM|nr:Rap1a/Tai family immunity protein [Marinicella sediminis]